MFIGQTRFYELPDIQRTIDIFIGIIASFLIAYVWIHRKQIYVPLVNFSKFSYVMLCWIHSDFFSILAVLFFKNGHAKIAEKCRNQAFRTIGTVPLLAISHYFGHKEGLKEFVPKNQCNFCKFFHFSL